jgi:hypothetical protein
MYRMLSFLIGAILLAVGFWTVPSGATVEERPVGPQSSFAAPDTLPVTVANPISRRTRFGLTIESLPDANGDGTPDLLVSAPKAGPKDPMREGRVYAVSGQDGQIIDTLAYPDAQQPDSLSYERSFGRHMDRVGDLNGDGTDDVIVTSLGTPPTVVSGATLDPLRLLPYSVKFATSFASFGDQTGDGHDELLVGGTYLDSVYVLDGATGAVRRTMPPPQSAAGEGFGKTLAAVGDPNDDGVPDVAVGAPLDTLQDADGAGCVFLLDGRDGDRLHTLMAPSPQARASFGAALTAPGDVTGDGTPDLVVGEPRRSVDNVRGVGRAYVFDGETGALVHTLSSPVPDKGWAFGASLAAVGDLDGDETSDLLVGGDGRRGRGLPETLQGFLISGARGRPLQVNGRLASHGPPAAVAAPGDLNGDGTPDLVFAGGRGVTMVSGAQARAPLSPRATTDERPARVHRYPVKHNGQWGYIDATGEVVIEPQFEDAEPFSGGRAMVQRDGRPVFIDSTGATVLRPEVSGVRAFSEGLAAASPVDTPLWGFIDTTGAFVIDPQFLTAYSFSNGRAAVEKNGAFGYVNRSGEMVIEPQYENARRFGNGRAPVLVEKQVQEVWGYIGRSGDMVIEPQYAGALPFSEGRAAVNTSDEQFDAAYEYINRSGEIVTESSLSFGGALSFSEGRAPVKDGFDDRWGYVDREGKMVIEPKYVFAEPFHGPLARVATSYRGGIGVQYGGPLPEYTVKGPEWVYLNRDGEQVWPR